MKTMGCLNSKKVSSELHPNVFRVVNIDENGAELCSGELEITDSDIVLYREGRGSTVWPLHSLRRYGFENEIFSFESGRRCETGEGIYGFRCRRASLLFRTLQQQIQLRNVIHGAVPYPVSRMTPSPQSRQTLQASVVHRSSLDHGQPIYIDIRPAVNNNMSAMIQNSVQMHVNQSHRSPSSADILEVMPLYPRNQNNTTQATNVYQVREFKREPNNNLGETSVDGRHEYSNDLNRDLAILRNSLKHETALNNMKDFEDETNFLEGGYVNENIVASNLPSDKNPLSPTLSTSSEHYAQLSLQLLDSRNQELASETQESNVMAPTYTPTKDSEAECVIENPKDPARLYMNIALKEINIPEVSRYQKPTTPSTPPTPKQVEYCNISLGVRQQEANTYANLTLGEHDNVKNKNGEHIQKFSEADHFTFLPPVEEVKVNYAILDMDSNMESSRIIREIISPQSQSFNSSKNDGMTSRGRLTSQCSTEKSINMNAPSASVGYTTIDFDKTVALTSVAANTDIDVDGVRKARHNSSCSSPSNCDKNKVFT